MRVAVGGHNGDEDEAKLLRRASKGDRKAWERLFELCYEPLERYILFRLGPNQARLESCDVAQEVILRAFQTLPGHRCESLSSFREWLRRVADKAIEDLIRSYGCAKRNVPGDRFGRLAKAIEALPPEQGKAVVLFWLQGIPAKEIGKRMGRTASEVWVLIHRGVRQLRRIVSDTVSLSLPSDRPFRPGED